MADLDQQRLPGVTAPGIGAALPVGALIVALLVVPVPPTVRGVGVGLLVALLVATMVVLTIASRRAATVVPRRTRLLASAATFWGTFTGGMFLFSVLRGPGRPVEAVVTGVLMLAVWTAVMSWAERHRTSR